MQASIKWNTSSAATSPNQPSPKSPPAAHTTTQTGKMITYSRSHANQVANIWRMPRRNAKAQTSRALSGGRRRSRSYSQPDAFAQGALTTHSVMAEVLDFTTLRQLYDFISYLPTSMS